MRKLAVLSLLLAFCVPTLLLRAQSRARRVTGNTPATAPTASPQPGGRPPVLSGQREARPSSSNETGSAAPSGPEEVGEDEVVRVNTTLITIPVSVMDRDGKYIPYLRKEDFRLFEEGVEQEIAYFGSTEKPFTVALMLDMSRSTRFRIDEIQEAALAFVNQLRPEDRVMVVTFDDEIDVLTEPTSDRAELRRAISRARTGGGTSLYDAVDFVMNKRFNRLPGRKAIVLFTDGVDSTSRRASYESTVRDAEELDALIYPVQYDTYDGGGGSVNWPRRRGPSIGWPFPMPFPIPLPGPSGGGGGNGSRSDYDRGTAYLNDLAQRTGARVSRADGLRDLDRAFELIAEELRRQYSVGYYPKNMARAGERRQIKVRMRDPNFVVRARDTYLTGSAGAVATQSERKKQYAPLF